MSRELKKRLWIVVLLTPITTIICLLLLGIINYVLHIDELIPMEIQMFITIVFASYLVVAPYFNHKIEFTKKTEKFQHSMETSLKFYPLYISCMTIIFSVLFISILISPVFFVGAHWLYKILLPIVFWVVANVVYFGCAYFISYIKN